MHAKLGLAALLAAVVSCPSVGHATAYTYITIDPPGGGTDVLATGIDDSGTIYGYANSGANGFVYKNGTYTTVDYPSALDTEFAEASPGGQVAGTEFGLGSGFVYSGGTFQTFSDPLATEGTFGYAVNDAGTVVGMYYTSNYLYNGFVYTNGNFTTLNYPGAVYGTILGGIDNAGVIDGWAYTASAQVAFTYANGTFTTISIPDGGGVQAFGSNSAGAIVGDYDDYANGMLQGFVDVAGMFSELVVPGSTYTVARDINDAGDIVGFYGTAGGTVLGFEAIPVTTPVPEPGCVAVLGMGALICRGLRRRGRRLPQV